jgi:hydroxyacylglutathione hydrolase
MFDVVDPGVVQIKLPKPAAHAYLFLGARTALVDCGTSESTPALVRALRVLGVSTSAVSLVVLTHEHADHSGGAWAFPDALLAAHPLAAAKLRHGDEHATHGTYTRSPDVELTHASAVHLGDFAFRVVHTPGHTSGSICLYERSRGLLVTGDTAYARGTLSLVSASGARGDHVASIERLAALPARLMLPGHGHVSEDPGRDLLETAAAARRDL